MYFNIISIKMSEAIIIEIIQIHQDFFSIYDLLQISSTSKFFYNNILIQRLLYKNAVSDLLYQELSLGQLLENIYIYTGINLLSLNLIPSLMKYSMNLINNPIGLSGFDG